MKRFFVVSWPLIVVLTLFFVISLSLEKKVWAEEDEPDIEITEEGKEAPAPHPECKARIEAPNPDFNFGAIRSSDANIITHTFVFRNAGEENLVINKIRPSCGCLSAIASATQIAPGATASITAALNPKGKFGKQTINVRVNTNDPTNESQNFRMSGMILSDWRVVPTQVDMGAMGKLQSTTKDVIVTSQYLKDDPRFKITSIKSDCPEIKAITAEAPAPKQEQPDNTFDEVQRIVRINVTGGTTEGEQSHRVYISTDDPKNPTHTVFVRWIVEGDLSCLPKKVFVSDVRGKKASRDLTLSSRSGQTFDVTSIELQGSKGNDDLEITLKPDSTPTRKVYTIKPKIVTDALTDTRSGKIIFKTTNPEQSVLSVPYIVTFRR